MSTKDDNNGNVERDEVPLDMTSTDDDTGDTYTERTLGDIMEHGFDLDDPDLWKALDQKE